MLNIKKRTAIRVVRAPERGRVASAQQTTWLETSPAGPGARQIALHTCSQVWHETEAAHIPTIRRDDVVSYKLETVVAGMHTTPWAGVRHTEKCADAGPTMRKAAEGDLEMLKLKGRTGVYCIIRQGKRDMIRHAGKLPKAIAMTAGVADYHWKILITGMSMQEQLVHTCRRHAGSCWMSSLAQQITHAL